MPYSKHKELCSLDNSINVLESIYECEQKSIHHVPESDESLIGKIRGSEYEMLLILLARTGYVSLTLYEQIRHISGLNYFYDYLKKREISKGSILAYR